MCAETLSDADSANIKDSIESFTRALETKDFDKWISYWAEDGVLMPPGYPRVAGRAAILKYMQANFGDVKSVNLSNWQIILDGALAVVSTNVEWTSDTDGKTSDPMKQMLALSKDKSGTWMLKFVIFNAGV